jgi:hypothetical protein
MNTLSKTTVPVRVKKTTWSKMRNHCDKTGAKQLTYATNAIENQLSKEQIKTK